MTSTSSKALPPFRSTFELASLLVTGRSIRSGPFVCRGREILDIARGRRYAYRDSYDAAVVFTELVGKTALRKAMFASGGHDG